MTGWYQFTCPTCTRLCHTLGLGSWAISKQHECQRGSFAQCKWSPELTNHSQYVCKRGSCTQHLSGLGERYLYLPLSFTPVVILANAYLAQTNMKINKNSVTLRPTFDFTVSAVSAEWITSLKPSSCTTRYFSSSVTMCTGRYKLHGKKGLWEHMPPGIRVPGRETPRYKVAKYLNGPHFRSMQALVMQWLY